MTWKKPTDEQRYNRHVARNYEPLPLAQSIARNRRKHQRFSRAERMLLAMRQRIFDYEDHDEEHGTRRAEKARRIMNLAKAILAPKWHAERMRAQAAQLERTPSRFEPGRCG